MKHIIMSDKNLQYARRFYNNEINSNDYDFIKSNRMHAKLLRGSDATLITYSVKGCDLSDTEIEEINSITGNSKLKRRLQAIYAKGASIEFKSFDSQVFMCNLQLIDYGLPTVLASCVLKYFSSERISMVKE